MMKTFTVFACTVMGAMLMGGCATKVPPYDYTAFNQAKPVTLLVLPPVNESPDVKATPSLWANAAKPLSEAGYYVLPVTLVDETLRQNGVDTATDAHSIAVNKLRDYFGADAAVYIKVARYGSTYSVVMSETVVEANAKIVDLRSGALLWEGKARASSAEQQQNQGGVAGLLIAALVQQVLSTTTDAAHSYAGIASERLFAAPRYNGVLPGPRSPMYGKAVSTP
ncbi:DUF799 domain-containing protein [Hydrogenophaga sp.]|uniref:DUF799 domain-containing protein n=1 Tax=Hydrogenophaga sp. TaxID=1904254 RepID=UPI00286DDDEE|nr:DUF799 domain-containing protein [Hydrogenophaga sp.]